ncbi:MAG: hypothetical protein IPJ82_03780 [Lewinellaceae bacterium]|nr:hypothetical protein [Lewinellaceae bacterium]
MEGIDVKETKWANLVELNANLHNGSQIKFTDIEIEEEIHIEENANPLIYLILCNCRLCNCVSFKEARVQSITIKESIIEGTVFANRSFLGSVRFYN